MFITLKRVKKRVTAAWKLKANWFATQTGKQWKTMVNNENNELPLFKRTNQERPYEQLLHYREKMKQNELIQCNK